MLRRRALWPVSTTFAAAPLSMARRGVRTRGTTSAHQHEAAAPEGQTATSTTAGTADTNSTLNLAALKAMALGNFTVASTSNDQSAAQQNSSSPMHVSLWWWFWGYPSWGGWLWVLLVVGVAVLLIAADDKTKHLFEGRPRYEWDVGGSETRLAATGGSGHVDSPWFTLCGRRFLVRLWPYGRYGTRQLPHVETIQVFSDCPVTESTWLRLHIEGDRLEQTVQRLVGPGTIVVSDEDDSDASSHGMVKLLSYTLPRERIQRRSIDAPRHLSLIALQFAVKTPPPASNTSTPSRTPTT